VLVGGGCNIVAQLDVGVRDHFHSLEVGRGGRPRCVVRGTVVVRVCVAVEGVVPTLVLDFVAADAAYALLDEEYRGHEEHDNAASDSDSPHIVGGGF